ncbi:MAG: hypothetical protein RL299_1692 [Pseudomonadota bacterium]|jgi:hypothetical protein
MSTRRASPFSPRTVLGLVVVGALAFVALLWSIGAGMADSEPRAFGGHAGGKGLNGYSALYQYLDARGFAVSKVQSRPALKQPGLVVLTPTHETKIKEIADTVEARRFIGPTVVIMPKWRAMPIPRQLSPKAKDGFVMLVEPEVPDWKGFHDEITVNLDAQGENDTAKRWFGFGSNALLADPKNVISANGGRLVPLVETGTSARTLVGYLADGGDYPALRADALTAEPDPPETGLEDYPAEDEPVADDPEAVQSVELPQEVQAAAPAPPPAAINLTPTKDYTDAYPLVLVFEADLFNNYGMARQPNALMAERLMLAALDGEERKIAFDLTLAGYGRSQNLLELAFTPPFLAATLCLLLAALVAGWRAYFRFGPPLIAARSLAFGKRALVGNSAGLLRRAKRLHLARAPYADAARERLVKALALPQRLDAQAAELAIDRALAARDPAATPFSQAAAALRSAKGPRDMLRAAQTLHSLERILTR